MPSPALSLTFADMGATLASALSPAYATKRVIDEATGEEVARLFVREDRVDWSGSGSFGSRPTVDECLAEIEVAVLRQRACEAEDRAQAAAIDALPEPIRSLTHARNRAAVLVQIERHRVIIRKDDLRRAEDALARAEAALANAKRERAVAA